jgi:hypothetical protein
MAPSTRAILDAWSRQIEASTEENGTAMQAADLAAEGLGNVVCIYDTALWDQLAPYNNECPNINGSRAVTGCVATAMAIVCHYNQWPKKGTGTTPSYSYTDEYEYRDHTIKANTLGRSYDYNKMLHNYSTANYTTAQGNAVAALMYDMGTSVQMMYHYIASGAFSELVPSAMSTYFSYSKEAVLCRRDGYSAKEWYNILKTNIDKCGPSLYSGAGNEGGHAFVVDGYTDKNYFHFNFGWSGLDNGYYLIPNIEFYWGQEVILNLEPDRDGTSQYTDNIVLTSLYYSEGVIAYNGIMSTAKGYQPGTEFKCSIGGIANYGTGTFNGDIKLVVCNEDGVWKQELWGETVSVNPGSFIYTDVDCTITQTFEEGDRIRIYYKSQNSNSWEWLRRKSVVEIDEVIVVASPEDMADGLTFYYDKTTQKVGVINSNAMHIEIYDTATESLAGRGDLSANENGTISLPNGVYRFECSLGGEPYKLIVKL